MTDHDKLEELLRIKAQAPVRFRVIVDSNACTEMSLEMPDPARFAFAYMFGHVRQSGEIVTMMAASKENA
jgi:hypothetical protein